MSQQIILTIPTSEQLLTNELQKRLATYAEIEARPPSTYDLRVFTLIVEIVALGAGTLEIINNFLELRDRFVQQGQAQNITISKPGGPKQTLDQVDEAFLRKLLEIDDNS